MWRGQEGREGWTQVCVSLSTFSHLFGCPVLAVLVLDSGTWLDAWRAVPVQTDPGYVREVR